MLENCVVFHPHESHFSLNNVCQLKFHNEQMYVQWSPGTVNYHIPLHASFSPSKCLYVTASAPHKCRITVWSSSPMNRISIWRLLANSNSTMNECMTYKHPPTVNYHIPLHACFHLLNTFMSPLSDGTSPIWTKECTMAFEEFKRKLVSLPVLVAPC